MEVWRITERVLLTLFFTIVLVAGVFFFVIDNHFQENCERIEKIARNSKSVAYLDNWASDHILDKGYNFVTGMHGDITASKGNEFVKISPLPEENISGI